MNATRILFIHGAAVTSAIWRPVLDELSAYPDYELSIVERPRTGDLVRETAWLAERARGCFVVGASGGATLGLALAASEVHLVGALLHEPAVGSLQPTLLNGVVAAFAERGVAGFGSTLYGSMWNESMAPGDHASLSAELAMFRAFEPAAPSSHQGPVTVSVGALSPPPRHASVTALAQRFDLARVTVPAARHFVSLEAPVEFAAIIRGCVPTDQ